MTFARITQRNKCRETNSSVGGEQVGDNDDSYGRVGNYGGGSNKGVGGRGGGSGGNSYGGRRGVVDGRGRGYVNQGVQGVASYGANVGARG